jgi:KDO2-lipid IV(A) lauroyltransferase
MWKYLLFLIAIHTIGRLPLSAGYALAGLVGRLSYWLSSGSRGNVISNLRHAMGEGASEGEVRAAARRVFVNVAKYYVDLVRMPYMNLDDFYSKRFRYYGFDEYLIPAVKAGKAVIVLSAHLGNPELAIQGMMPRGVKAFALTEPLEPERLHRLVDSLRSSKGHEFAPVGFAGVKRAIQVLRQGGVVALMGDRDIEGPKALLPFFGEETLMPTGPIEVAMRTGAVLIPSFCYRTGRYGIEAHLLPPMELERSGDNERDIRSHALRFLALLEEHIRKAPDQWVVLESVWDAAAAESRRRPEKVGEKA